MNDIIILGPTSSGKTNLANFIASNNLRPIINCDSVQIYKDLNFLSNKPEFESCEISHGEVVNYYKVSGVFNIKKYSNFKFKVIRRKARQLIFSHELDHLEFLEWLVDMNIIANSIEIDEKIIDNYLFDIKNPGESYSVAEFCQDVKRIEEKINNVDKIIVGGTIYYAYHYLLNTDFDDNKFSNFKLIENNPQFSNIENWDLEKLVDFLNEFDKKSLEILDQNNKPRLQKAVYYILNSGEKYSEKYYKNNELKEDFLLILIYPKDRDIYTSQLNKVIENRIKSRKVSQEINFLNQKYPDKVNWLKSISYEYRYAIEINDLFEKTLDLSKVKDLIEELKIKERQYTKRQVSFMKMVEKRLYS